MSHQAALIHHGDHPVCSKQQPHTADSTGPGLARHPHCCCHMEGTFARHHFMLLSPSLQERGKEGRWKGMEGKREAHPERMLDKDGSRDILSTLISSGGGELCWILACYWQSHTLWCADGEHVTIKSTPPHFYLSHWKSGTYGAGCQLLILYGN